MIDENYIHSLIRKFLNQENSEIDVEEMNEIAASLADEVCSTQIWKSLLNTCLTIDSPVKRRYLGIFIFEVLIEEPVYHLWLDSFKYILSEGRLHWVIAEAYRNNKELFYDQFLMAYGEACS